MNETTRTLVGVLSNPHNHIAARERARQTLIHNAIVGSDLDRAELSSLILEADLSSPCPCDGCRRTAVSANHLLEHQVTGNPQIPRPRSSGYSA